MQFSQPWGRAPQHHLAEMLAWQTLKHKAHHETQGSLYSSKRPVSGSRARRPPASQQPAWPRASTRPRSCVCSRTSALPFQVYVFWQSLSYARARAGTTPILWLNMDETAVQVCPRIGPGLVVKRRHWHQFAPRAANRKSARRAAVTYMGLVCSEDRVQPSLPQVIKANKHLFPQTSTTPVGGLGQRTHV